MIPDQLHTSNLTLRPFSAEDGSAVYAYWKSDPGWERFNISVPSGFTESDADDFVSAMCGRDRSEQPNWAIVHDDRVVGVVSLNFEAGHGTGSIGYGIHADLRGRGLCVEAATAALDSAFATYPALNEIRAYTHKDNHPSVRVVKKMGFIEETGGNDDGRTFCLLRSAWKAPE